MVTAKFLQRRPNNRCLGQGTRIEVRTTRPHSAHSTKFPPSLYKAESSKENIIRRDDFPFPATGQTNSSRAMIFLATPLFSQLMGQGDSLDPSGATKRSRSQLHEADHKGGPSKLYESGSLPGLSKPWKQKPRHLASYNTAKAGGAHSGQPKREEKHQPSRVLPPLPDGLRASKEMLRGWGAEIASEPRRARRWIETPDDGAKVDLARLENTRPLPPRPLGAFRSQLPESASMRVLVGSDKVAGGVSPRIGRTVRRLADMESCLRNLDDSMRELQAGEAVLCSMFQWWRRRCVLESGKETQVLDSQPKTSYYFQPRTLPGIY